MKLSDLKTGDKGIIVKVHGEGSFRKRLIEMGFIAGKHVEVVLNAPLKDPIEYEILGYKVSIRRKEADMIEVVKSKKEYDGLIKEPMSVSQSQQAEPEDIISPQKHDEKVIKLALVGNPNCGKTSLFNIASGSHEHVGNYSGVTVDAKEGKFEYKGYKFILCDLPGTYSLSAYSPEELYVRKNLTENTPDIVINVVDASNLERNLYLTTQLIDMNLRMVMALNMYDELQAKGDKLNYKLLGSLLGMPVCPTISRTGEGVDKLFDTIIEIHDNPNSNLSRHIHVVLGHEIEKSVRVLKDLIKKNEYIRKKYSTRYLAIKYLEGDKEVAKIVEDFPNRDEIISARLIETKRLVDILETSPESAIVDAKYGFIQGALKECYEPGKVKTKESGLTDKIDKIITNTYLAFPIFVLVLYIIFQATFTLGQYPMDWIDAFVKFINNSLGNYLSEGWFKDLLTNGVISGVGSVLVFLPNIMILYFFISLLEDSGYMARAAFIVDKLMHKMGLHGKSFIPMVMGFGCNVPAIMATRTIESRKSRLITMLVIPFMSCSGRLPVFVLLAGAFFSQKAGLALLLIYLLGIVIGVITAAVLGKFIKEDDLPFVMELPPYRIPTRKAIWRHTWEKGRQYLQKMGTTILLCSILIWFLGYYPKNENLSIAQNQFNSYSEKYNDIQRVISVDSTKKYTTNLELDKELQNISSIKDSLTNEINVLYEKQQENSYIGQIGKVISPVLSPMGFDWKMNVGLLTGIAAKELVVSTLGVMYARGADVVAQNQLESDTGLQSAISNSLSYTEVNGKLVHNEGRAKAIGLAYMVFILLYFPCVATFVAIKNESGRWLIACLCCVYTMFVAWIMAFLAYHLGLLIF